MWKSNPLALCVAVTTLVEPTLAAAAPEYDWQASATGTFLDAGDRRIDEDWTLSVDVTAERRTDAGRWLVYLEGNSTPRRAGVSTLLVEASAEARTAVDEHGDGRLQVSEFNYQRFLGADRLTVGLLDATVYLDASAISNDENSQFLGVPFVNNPAVEFPDYSLGAVYQRTARGAGPGYTFVLASSNGLADNPRRSYHQLVRISDSAKGVFGAAELGWQSANWRLRLGAWANTREHASLRTGRASAQDNYGAFALLGTEFDDHALDLRVGAANDNVSQAAGFVSLAYQYSWAGHALGIAGARTYLSHRQPDIETDTTPPVELRDAGQFEAYARFEVRPALHLSLSVQRLINTSFGDTTVAPVRHATVVALRVHAAL